MKYLLCLSLCWLLFSCGGINKITFQRTGTIIVESYNDEVHLTNEYQESIKLITSRLNEECDSIITKKGTIIVAEIIEKTNEIVWYKPCPEKSEITKWIPLSEVVKIIPSKVERHGNSKTNKTINENKIANKKSDGMNKDDATSRSMTHNKHHNVEWAKKVLTRRKKAAIALLIIGICLTGGVIGLFIWLFGLAS